MARNIKNEKIVAAWNDAYGSQDVDGAVRFMSDDFFRTGDCTRWVPSYRTRWAAGQKPFFKAFPNWRWEMLDMRSDGDWVVCEFLERGTWTEPYVLLAGDILPPGVPTLIMAPTGESYSDYNCDWFKLNDAGIIIELNAYVTNTLDRVFDLERRIGAHIATHQRVPA